MMGKLGQVIHMIQVPHRLTITLSWLVAHGLAQGMEPWDRLLVAQSMKQQYTTATIKS